MGGGATLPEDQLPKFEGIRRAYKSRKAFTDLLGPLKRWLQSQVGRPWNDVYSEACEVIKADSPIRAHVKTHLLEFVERHTFMRDGVVCIIDTSRKGGIIPVTAKRFGYTLFYVHPETGLLHRIDPTSRNEWRKARGEKQREALHWLNDHFALKQINRIWFTCQFKEVPLQGPFKAYDHAREQTVGLGGLVRREKVYLHCIAKRQLSRRELRRYGLRNAAAVAGTRSSVCPQTYLRPRSITNSMGPLVDPNQKICNTSDHFARRGQQVLVKEYTGLSWRFNSAPAPQIFGLQTLKRCSGALDRRVRSPALVGWRPTNFLCRCGSVATASVL